MCYVGYGKIGCGKMAIAAPLRTLPRHDWFPPAVPCRFHLFACLQCRHHALTMNRLIRLGSQYLLHRRCRHHLHHRRCRRRPPRGTG